LTPEANFNSLAINTFDQTAAAQKGGPRWPTLCHKMSDCSAFFWSMGPFCGSTNCETWTLRFYLRICFLKRRGSQILPNRWSVVLS